MTTLERPHTLDPLAREDFAAFFAAVHDGNPPFAWQERLLDEVLRTRRWPNRIAAPTGAGKTAVIDVHVFALALTASTPEGRPPRRLAMVVDRRVLVDDQHRHARTLATRLEQAGEGVLGVVARRLRSLRTDAGEGEIATPLVVARLRGGQPPSRSWRDHPAAAAVLCATPDMWGSRLLFRGYGSSWKAWPREAGLLAFDSVVVVDEAHLTPQLLCTARRVSRLAGVAERGLGAAPLQIVETTATPGVADPELTEVGVEQTDLDADPVLRDRLTRPKPVARVVAPDWASARSRRAVTALADAVQDAQSRVEGLDGVAARTVGCFVNSVARAVATAAELRARGQRVVMICGQVRPHDVERLTSRASEGSSGGFPGLLTPRGHDDVDVIVSTQSLEVGVDLDLAAMVTELASAPALAQRAGRVNRRGLRADGPITVVGPVEIDERTRSGPYESVDLRAGAAWLDELDADGMTPWALRERPACAATSRRRLQRPELGHAQYWARTSDPLHAEPALELWLAEDFERDLSVGLVVRRELPEDPTEAVELLRLLRPATHEVFPVPLGALREALTGPDRVPAYVVREDVEILEYRQDAERRESEEAPRPVLRPGDLVVVDAATPLFTESVDSGSPPVLLPDDDAGTTARHPAPDVLEGRAALVDSWAGREQGGVVRRWDFVDAAGTRLEAMLPLTEVVHDVDPAGLRVPLREWLRGNIDGPMDKAVVRLLQQRAALSDVQVLRDADGPRHLVVVDRRRADADEGVRQTWSSGATEPVTLAAHQHDVGERAGLLASSLGLDDELTGLVRTAGEHHDDGKADARFQALLGAPELPEPTVLAKSPPDTTKARARERAKLSGVPSGWRHEQFSVLRCWTAVQASRDPELVARLVGTSHGHGRSGFPDTAARLVVGPDADAVELFDLGGWDQLIERTHQRYGLWGCAYLEALLRAADGQISREGR